jgi:signal transduction histidine kinase
MTMSLERQRRLLKDLEPPVAKFAAASGLTLALYDLAGQRQTGPLGLTELGVLLENAGAWEEHGTASRVERSVAQDAISTGAPGQARVAELAVWAVPLRVRDVTIGAAVFGWIPDSFGSSMGAAVLAKTFGTHPSATWKLLRASVPVSSQRLSLFAELLENLLLSHASHLEYLEASRAISRTRDQFIAQAAHELRSPLAAIAMRVEYLLLDETREDIRAELRKITASVASESRLIEDLIEASQTLTGQLKVNLTATNVRDLVNECVESFVPEALKRSLSLTSSVLDRDVFVRGDSARLRQALSNLLGNALKFTDAGGRIRIQVNDGGTDVSIAVVDTGRGLTPEQLERVFEAFYKSDYQNETGLGLGLAITQQIVDLHGGTLAVTSDGPGKGATFTIQLPRGETERVAM